MAEPAIPARHEPSLFASSFEEPRPRSGMSIWLAAAAALVIGIGIGFASGYRAGKGSTSVAATAAENPAATSGATGGQPFSESSVQEPVKLNPEPIVPAPGVPAGPPRGLSSVAAPAPQQSKAQGLSPVVAPAPQQSRAQGLNPVAAPAPQQSKAQGLNPVAAAAPQQNKARGLKPAAAPAPQKTAEPVPAPTGPPGPPRRIERAAEPGPRNKEQGPKPLVETPPAGPASLDVVSRPSGAQVIFDGRVIGKTPMTIPDVAAGDHSIRLELAGFKGWATAVAVKAGIATRVAASLEQ